MQQAQADLQKLLSPSTAADLEAQRQAVASAQAALSLAQTPYLPSDILSARAAGDKARADLATAQENLAGAMIVAPYDGIISAVGLNVGETSSGAPPGATSASATPTPSSGTITIVDPSQIRIDVQVDESDIPLVDVGQHASVTFDALGARPFDGLITAISPSGSTTQGVVGYQVGIELRNVRGVRPGMTATAQIVTDEHDDVLLVPNRAVSRQGNSRVVQLATPNGPQSRVVEVGLSNDQSTEITSGLVEGDTVLLPATAARPSVPGAGTAPGGPA